MGRKAREKREHRAGAGGGVLVDDPLRAEAVVNIPDHVLAEAAVNISDLRATGMRRLQTGRLRRSITSESPVVVGSRNVYVTFGPITFEFEIGVVGAEFYRDPDPLTGVVADLVEDECCRTDAQIVGNHKHLRSCKRLRCPVAEVIDVDVDAPSSIDAIDAIQALVPRRRT
jgi:hypothetical protein